MRKIIAAMLAMSLLLPDFVKAANPTPEPTQTPRATPTPDPDRPSRNREDTEKPLVSFQWAPENYKNDRNRGTVLYDSRIRNYSWHTVILPATRPLIISNKSFVQELTPTVVFWDLTDQGNNLITAGSGTVVTPNGHNVRARDVRCSVLIRGAGWRRDVYDIVSQDGTSWTLDRTATNTVPNDSAQWRLFCPTRDFTDITFDSCNLQNVWLPTALGPTITHSNIVQSDVPPDITPTPTP